MPANGYHDLEPGQLAALVTYLRHDLASLPAPPVWPKGFALGRLASVSPESYRALFRAIGADWLWFGRLHLDDTALMALLADPDYEAYVLADGDREAGLVELDFRAGREPELAYFGLVPGWIGRGLGRSMMAAALQRAKTRGAASLMVHTCAFDAPDALGFYRRSGFAPFARAIEVFTDPRLDGTLPREAAAQIPLMG